MFYATVIFSEDTDSTTDCEIEISKIHIFTFPEQPSNLKIAIAKVILNNPDQYRELLLHLAHQARAPISAINYNEYKDPYQYGLNICSPEFVQKMTECDAYNDDLTFKVLKKFSPREISELLNAFHFSIKVTQPVYSHSY